MDYSVRYLDSIGVPKNKVAIGAAFYGKIWENIENINNGCYQPATWKGSVPYKKLNNYFTEHPDLEEKWDSLSQAPYAYDPTHKLFLSYDNLQSVQLKTKYARENRLDGIMFWQLGSDKNEGGLLDGIYEVSLLE